MASPDPLAVSDTETPKRCSSRVWAGLLDKNNEHIAVLAVTGLHSISQPLSVTKIIQQNDSLSAYDEEQLPTHPGKHSSKHIFCKFISQQFHAQGKEHTYFSPAVYSLRCWRMLIVYHLMLHNLWLIVNRNSYLKASQCKVLKMFIEENNP